MISRDPRAYDFSRDFPYALLYLAGTSLIYSGSLNGEFIFDDFLYVVKNHLIKNFDLQGIAEIFASFYLWDYLPVTMFSFSLDYWLYGLNPWGYHLTNTFLHFLNTVLLHLVVVRITGSKVVALATALFFLVHPVNVESVAWISERKNVLSCFFLLCSFYCYLQGNRRVRVVLFFLLACLSKSSVVIFPLLLVLYDLPFTAKKIKTSIFENSPCFAISASVVALTFLTHSMHGTVREHPEGNPLNTLYSMVVVFKEYLAKLFFPVNLNVWYPNQVFTSPLQFEVLISCLLIGIFIVLAITAYHRNRILFFGMLWFVICLLPVSHIIPFPQMMADRFLYLPAIGLFLAVSVSARKLLDGLGPKKYL
jgi:protein O-mannosyl-transferase